MLKAPNGVAMPLAKAAKAANIVEDSTTAGEWIKIEWSLKPADLLSLKSSGVDTANVKPGAPLQGYVKVGPKVKRFALGQLGSRAALSIEAKAYWVTLITNGDRLL